MGQQNSSSSSQQIQRTSATPAAEESPPIAAKSLLSIGRKARQKKLAKGNIRKNKGDGQHSPAGQQQTPSKQQPFCTAGGMNPRFPVESGESLSAAIAPIPKPPRAVQIHSIPDEINSSQQLPVWVYVIFRKNPSSGHDKINIKDSLDGPVFWTRRVIYVFCCSCHFDRHERDLLKLLEQWKSRVERVCLVDRPLDYPFLPDSLFGFLANHLPRLEFVYLRELDLEKINRATVERLSQHRHLKKLIVHGCRNFEALQDFHNLPQLLVVKGDIQGLKAMIGCEDPALEESSSSNGPTPKNGTSKEGSAIRNGI